MADKKPSDKTKEKSKKNPTKKEKPEEILVKSLVNIPYDIVIFSDLNQRL